MSDKRIPVLVLKPAEIDISVVMPKDYEGLGFPDNEDIEHCSECGAKQTYVLPLYGEVEFTLKNRKKIKIIEPIGQEYFCAVCGHYAGGIAAYTEEGEDRVVKRFCSKEEADEYEAKQRYFRKPIPFDVLKKKK